VIWIQQNRCRGPHEEEGKPALTSLSACRLGFFRATGTGRDLNLTRHRQKQTRLKNRKTRNSNIESREARDETNSNFPNSKFLNFPIGDICNLVIGNTLAFLQSLSRNPSRPPFFKGRRAYRESATRDSTFSPFEKGGRRGIGGLFKRLNCYRHLRLLRISDFVLRIYTRLIRNNFVAIGLKRRHYEVTGGISFEP